MAHIHDKIDFTVAAFIVYKTDVLLIFHKKLQKWLPVGGHIELDEDPIEGLFREVKEETGIGKDDLKLYGEKPDFESPGTKFLVSPTYLDMHDISETHKHIGMVYFLRSKTDKITLEEEAHEAIEWVSEKELDSTRLNLTPAVKFYAKEAIHKLKV